MNSSAAPSSLVPAVIGHRGAAGHAPENTLVSIRKAAELGARWVEFDVKLTLDRELILFHDDTLDRTTDAKGSIAVRTIGEIKALDAGAWYEKRFTGTRVPTLTEALNELATLGLGANVEIKPSPGQEVETAQAVAHVLRNRWPSRLPAPVISSFRMESLAAAQTVAPEIERAALFFRLPDDWQRQAFALGAKAVHASEKHMTRDKTNSIKGAGFALRCYTVNDAKRAETLFGWGVDAIFTDYPDRIRAT